MHHPINSVRSRSMSYSESELIQKLKGREPQMMEAVVRLHTDHLYKACLGLGFQKYDAEDIVQNVWITFFDAVVLFEERSSLRTFLFGILYNKASEYRKQASRSVSMENITDIVDAYFDQTGHWLQSHSPVNPDRFLESSENKSLIANCLELLPMNQKIAFMLKEIEEEATEQICNMLNVTATNLGVLLYRARNQLRDCVDRKSR